MKLNTPGVVDAAGVGAELDDGAMVADDDTEKNSVGDDDGVKSDSAKQSIPTNTLPENPGRFEISTQVPHWNPLVSSCEAVSQSD